MTVDIYSVPSWERDVALEGSLAYMNYELMVDLEDYLKIRNLLASCLPFISHVTSEGDLQQRVRDALKESSPSSEKE